MKKFIVFLSTATMFAFNFAQAQNIQVKAHHRDAERGANPNIRMDVPLKDVEAPKPAGYHTPDMQRGANMQVIQRKPHEITRGANSNIVKDEPNKDIEAVRPAYNNPKQISVKHNITNKMRGADANIRNDEPTVDQEIPRPANYQPANTKGKTVILVQRKTVEKSRGANPHIITDVPTKDIEQPRIEK